MHELVEDESIPHASQSLGAKLLIDQVLETIKNSKYRELAREALERFAHDGNIRSLLHACQIRHGHFKFGANNRVSDRHLFYCGGSAADDRLRQMIKSSKRYKKGARVLHYMVHHDRVEYEAEVRDWHLYDVVQKAFLKVKKQHETKPASPNDVPDSNPFNEETDKYTMFELARIPQQRGAIIDAFVAKTGKTKAKASYLLKVLSQPRNPKNKWLSTKQETAGANGDILVHLVRYVEEKKVEEKIAV